MAYPEPCKELQRRLHPFMVGIHSIRTFIYPVLIVAHLGKEEPPQRQDHTAGYQSQTLGGGLTGFPSSYTLGGDFENGNILGLGAPSSSLAFLYASHLQHYMYCCPRHPRSSGRSSTCPKTNQCPIQPRKLCGQSRCSLVAVIVLRMTASPKKCKSRSKALLVVHDLLVLLSPSISM